MCDSIDNRVQHGVDDRICERFGVIFAVKKGAVGLWRGYCCGIGHVMLERIVDIEVDCCHDGLIVSPRRRGGRLARREAICKEEVDGL